jgi:hypothetical protein
MCLFICIKTGATDVDSPLENITFLVTAPRGGFLSLRTAPRQPIERFTQAQLTSRQVLFVHTGMYSLLNKSNQIYFNIFYFKYTYNFNEMNF